MRSILLLFLLVCQSRILLAQNPGNFDTAFVKSYGGPGVDEGRDLKETSDKGLIIAGTTGSFGDGNSSFYLIKTDSLGVYQWSKAFGTSNNDIARSIELATDGGYFISGYSNGNPLTGYDGYLVKTDSQGNVQWTKNYGGADWDFFYNACIMPDGGLLLCGETYSGQNGGSDAYLVRTNASGDTLWTKTFGVYGGDDAFYSVEQKNNRIYVVGKQFNLSTNRSNASIYKLDFNGTILLENNYAPDNMQNAQYNDLGLSNNGTLLLCGKRILTADSSEHYVLRRIDTTNFSQIYSTTNNANFDMKCVMEGNFDNVYTLSRSQGGNGGYSALYFRFSPELYYLYNADFGGLYDEEAFEIIRTRKGYAFVGSTTSYGNANGSVDKNVYLVVFNRPDLVHDYFTLITELQDILSPVGIKTNKADAGKTTVYPNPVTTAATINLGSARLNDETLGYQLFDGQGRLVDEEDLLVTYDHVVISRKNIKAGVYTYRLKHNTAFISSGKLFVD